MADIVKKLEQFTTVTNNNGEIQILSMNEDGENNSPNNPSNTNTNRFNVTTPNMKSVIKFQNELKYKQILRDHEVRNTELQTKLDDLTK